MASQVEHCTSCSGRLKMLGLHIHQASQLGLWCYEKEIMWHQILYILLGQAVTQPLSPTFQSVRQCHPWYLLQVASLPCMFRLLSLLCTFCTTVACNQLACVQTQFGEFFWRGCLPSKASRSNNRLHCLRECTSAAATKGWAPLSHRFSTYVHVGVVGYTWAFRCGYKIRFSKLLKLLVFNYTLLHLDVLVWVTDLFFLAEHQRQCVTVKFTC